MKKIKNLLKKVGNLYIEGFNQMYSPSLKYGINLFI